MSYIFRHTLFALAFVLPGFALAEEPEVIREADREVVRDKTRVDFNDSLIDGELSGPEGGYTLGSGRISFDNLIELRRDFHEELTQSPDSDL